MTHYKDTLFGGLFGITCVFVSVLLADTVFRLRVFDPMLLIQTLTLLVIGIGAAVAYYVHYASTKRLESDDYLRKSINMLEEAYELLVDPDDDRIPNNDRLAWLSSARLIKRSLVISKRITVLSHKEIFSDTSQYWRWNFHSLLRFNEDYLPESFFRGVSWSPASTNRNTVSPAGGASRVIRRQSDALDQRSLTVIYRFMEWPSDLEDPLNDVTRLSEEELHRLDTFRSAALARYLRSPATAQ